VALACDHAREAGDVGREVWGAHVGRVPGSVETEDYAFRHLWKRKVRGCRERWIGLGRKKLKKEQGGGSWGQRG
jgi:hypothetical protein